MKEKAFQEKINYLNDLYGYILTRNGNVLDVSRSGEPFTKEIWVDELYDHLSPLFTQFYIRECWFRHSYRRSTTTFVLTFSFTNLARYKILYTVRERKVYIEIDDDVIDYDPPFIAEVALLVDESIKILKKIIPTYIPKHRIRFLTNGMSFALSNFSQYILEKIR